MFEVVDEKQCYDNGCNPLTLRWVDEMKGDVCRWEVGLSGNQESQEQRWTRRRVFNLPTVGRVDEAGVHDYDGTRRLKSHGWTGSIGNVECALVPRSPQVDLHTSS